MELELCLALPNVNASSKALGFDLNGDACAVSAAVHKRKRGFADAFGSNNATATLPLFVWQSIHDDDNNNNEGEDYNDDGDGGCAKKSAYNGRTAPVGWPPVKSAWRNAGDTRYVKVMMEGAAIGRKVDLSLHRSYATLLDAVDRLFATKHDEGGQFGLGADVPSLPTSASGHHRMFMYQDGEGEWMLLGDVSWETFVRSAKRLRILRCKEQKDA